VGLASFCEVLDLEELLLIKDFLVMAIVVSPGKEF
jgi:hypothetical protein